MLIKSGIHLRLSVDHSHGAAVVTVSGELDAATAPDLERFLGRATADQGAFVLDLTGVTFCDSVGLATVVEAIRGDVDLRVVGSRQVTRTVTLTGMDSTVCLFGSVPEALGGRTRHPAGSAATASSG